MQQIQITLTCQQSLDSSMEIDHEMLLHATAWECPNLYKLRCVILWMRMNTVQNAHSKFHSWSCAGIWHSSGIWIHNVMCVLGICHSRHYHPQWTEQWVVMIVTSGIWLELSRWKKNQKKPQLWQKSHSHSLA